MVNLRWMANIISDIGGISKFNLSLHLTLYYLISKVLGKQSKVQ